MWTLHRDSLFRVRATRLTGPPRRRVKGDKIVTWQKKSDVFKDGGLLREPPPSPNYTDIQTFTISTFYSDEDECFIAVPDWPPHALSTFGDTREKALYELCTVLRMVIEEGATLLQGNETRPGAGIGV